ncbi:MAG: hypothetical protein GWN18_06935, partial [Thermoplasmata archaeon]|nr:hypothetical protein [Thermoplasmata archaeon]NIT76882.1 hypothetical protein [Thermoplasmata archaeon]NIU48810.1 hypothetical protein [Thermoplasmata archaeon]NIW82300.1 hypothetical protein [Thermoplasmata archaeon]NIY03253.1 hypothetical protein [Thermoplasmata archaeon]
MVGISALLGKGTRAGSLRAPALILVALLGLLTLLLGVPSATAEDLLPPTAIITSPEDGAEFMVGETVTFDGSQSLDDDKDN